MSAELGVESNQKGRLTSGRIWWHPWGADMKRDFSDGAESVYVSTSRCCAKAERMANLKLHLMALRVQHSNLVHSAR